VSQTRFTKACLTAGLCPLIPIPLVDEMVKRAIMKRALAECTVAEGEPMDRQTLIILTRNNRSCLLGCLLACVWWPIKKLFKTFLYFLTLKECLDWAAETQIRLSMVDLAIGHGLLVRHAEALRETMDTVVNQHTGSPVMRILRTRSVPAIDKTLSDPVHRAIDVLFRAGGGEAALEAYKAHLQGLVAGTEEPV
jgi:hypothetical protein